MGTPYRLTSASVLQATSRPVSSVPVYEVYKMEQSSSCQSKSRMENDNQAEQGRFTFNDIHRYLHDGRYPDGYTKLALRKRAKFFCTRGADLFLCRWSIKLQRRLLRNVGGSMHSFMFTAYVDSLKVMTLT